MRITRKGVTLTASEAGKAWKAAIDGLIEKERRVGS